MSPAVQLALVPLEEAPVEVVSCMGATTAEDLLQANLVSKFRPYILRWNHMKYRFAPQRFHLEVEFTDHIRMLAIDSHCSEQELAPLPKSVKDEEI